MEFSKQLTQYYVRPERQIDMSYEQLINCNLDMGFTSVMRDGRDFHQITRDISISVQHFHDGRLTNLLFLEGQPIRLEFRDNEIISYYSDYIELRYILSGFLEVEIEGETIQFAENEICFINSMAYHRESIANSNCMFVNISIRREVFNESFLNNIGLTPLQKFLRLNIMKIGEQQHYLKFTPTSEKDSQKIIFRAISRSAAAILSALWTISPPATSTISAARTAGFTTKSCLNRSRNIWSPIWTLSNSVI